jgi:hypothetical protein
VPHTGPDMTLVLDDRGKECCVDCCGASYTDAPIYSSKHEAVNLGHCGFLYILASGQILVIAMVDFIAFGPI